MPTINRGPGDDVVIGGDEVIDDNAGNDTLSGGENLLGSQDVYDGGGIDTLQLHLTFADSQSEALRNDIANYLALLAAHVSSSSGEAAFRFSSMGLAAGGWENLEVTIAGDPITVVHADPADGTAKRAMTHPTDDIVLVVVRHTGNGRSHSTWRMLYRDEELERGMWLDCSRLHARRMARLAARVVAAFEGRAVHVREQHWKRAGGDMLAVSCERLPGSPARRRISGGTDATA
jgi:hypothetical protein